MLAAFGAQPAAHALAPTKEALTDIIAAGLSGTYHCTRVWSAWSYGTMGPDDFSPVDQSDTPAELADAILAALAAPAPVAQAELTDEQIVAALESAGVKFQRFMGGISGTKDCWSTAGSQDVRKLANGVRAALAAPAPASKLAGEPVAWMDSGETGGRGQQQFRVITAATKAGMSATIARAYSNPLFPPAAARVPLTAAQATRLWNNAPEQIRNDLGSPAALLRVLRFFEGVYRITAAGQEGGEA